MKKDNKPETLLNSLLFNESFYRNQYKDMLNFDPTSINKFFELSANLYFEKKEATKHWESIIKHRDNMKDMLKRDVGLKVALLDYFSNIETCFDNPMIIEMELFEKILKASKEDSKTGFYNYKYFLEILKNEIKRAKRNNFLISLLFFDIDYFKEFNDRYGHINGDNLLVYLASVLKKLFRTEDSIGRFGGDEFVIMLPHINKSGAIAAAKRIISTLKDQPFLIDNNADDRYICSLSIGITTYPDDADTLEVLLKKADNALYMAKKSGRNNYYHY